MPRLGSKGDVSISIEALNNAKVGIDGVIKDMRRMEKASEKSTRRMRQHFDKFKKKISSLRTVMAATGILYSFRSLLQMTGDIEEGWIGVAKTTGMAGEELGRFTQNIRDLSTTMKGITLKELQAISTIAGQLGIKGVDNLTEFTRVVGMMRVATNLTAEAAAENFAQISNIMKVPISMVEKMGSVMNELSNNSTATASNIANLAKRMGGAAKTLGLTTPEIMGLAATIKDMGIEVEVGGTAMSQVFQRMISNVEGFASAAGVPVEQFAEMVRSSPVEALRTLMQSLSEMDKFKAMEALENLGLSGIRVAGTILKMSGGVDVMNKNLAMANAEWARGTSLQKEYDTASKGMNSSLAQMGNEFAIAAEAIGEGLLPAVKWLIPNITWVVMLFIRFAQLLGEIPARMLNFTEATAQAFGNAIAGTILKVAEVVGEWTDILEGLADKALTMGVAFVNSFIEGIQSKAVDSYQAIKGWLSGIRDYLPFSPAKIGPLSDLDKSGMAFATTFAEGMLLGQVAVLDAAAHLGRQAKLGLTGGGTPDVPAGMSPAGAPRTGDEPMGSSGLTPHGGLGQAIELGISKLIPLKDKEREAFLKNNEAIIKSEQMRANIVGAANKGMEQQMLSLIETGKFSVGAMAQVMAQQVKIELVGLAARAAVQALYFTAMGIAGSTPWGAAIVGPGPVWFAAAKTMAMVSAGALIGAAGVHAAFGGSAERPAPGTVGGDPLITTSGAAAVPERVEQPKARPVMIFKVENLELLGDDSMDKFIEKLNDRAENYDVEVVATRTIE